MMNELTAAALKNSFLKQSISEKDYLASSELHEVLNKLNGDLFDNEIFDELWDQCKLNSKGQAKLIDFIENIIQAETILIQKQRESENQIRKIQGEMRLSSQLNDYAESKRLKDLLLSAKQAKIQARISLQILRKPFISFHSLLNSKGYKLDDVSNASEQIHQNDANAPQVVVISTKQALSTMLFTCLSLLGCELFMSFYIANYVSILVLGITVSIFFFQFFSRKTFKMLFLLMLVSLIVDSVWLVIHAKRLLGQQYAGEWPYSLNNYIKICFYLCMGVIFGKMVLLYMLYSEFDIDQTTYQQYEIWGAEYILRNEFDASQANKNPIGYAFSIDSFRKQ